MSSENFLYHSSSDGLNKNKYVAYVQIFISAVLPLKENMMLHDKQVLENKI